MVDQFMCISISRYAKKENVKKMKSPTILCIDGPYYCIESLYYVLCIVHEKQNITNYYIF
ncbi:hypothetical protein N665_2025s0004 [Sinapis alba]|nr:hypothetical protein N665_2025s0004 [Sinapis alba]